MTLSLRPCVWFSMRLYRSILKHYLLHFVRLTDAVEGVAAELQIVQKLVTFNLGYLKTITFCITNSSPLFEYHSLNPNPINHRPNFTTSINFRIPAPASAVVNSSIHETGSQGISSRYVGATTCCPWSRFGGASIRRRLTSRQIGNWRRN